ncbi:SCO family protein [Ancylobacter dichloromethanicus]|uniref:Copper-binding protein n=1 Tax=Ancylobacter dichloromethanicus TaxID=518825 RepID=A0A9W6JD00_9HYPH|nr:SCO family protein [Ancylobacter dichloromethanicus]MBS7552411.1 SCO family protein [Ancylobacter dichloromethanicus]GLK74151.1 copper-binding protein [Ancylobacter dichloromethanicus]
MSNRRVLLLLAAFVVGAVVIVASALALLPQGAGTVSNQVAIGGPFELVDQDGQKVTQETFAGAPALVFFGFTHCPDICPTSLFEMSQLFEALGPDARKVTGLFITVDPERDTPEVMKSYLGSFHPSIQGLSGTPEQIAAVIKAYRVYAKKVPTQDGDYTMDHTAIVYLMGKDGQFVAPFNLKRPPDEAAAELRRYL